MSVAAKDTGVADTSTVVLEADPKIAADAAAKVAADATAKAADAAKVVDPNVKTIFDAAKTPEELAAAKVLTDAALVGKLVMKEKPAWLADKFWDTKTGEVKVQDLAANEAHLRGLVSRADHKPPATADAYKVEFAPEQAALKVEYDAMIEGKDPLLLGVQEAAFKAGVSNGQFQEVVKAYLGGALEALPPPLDPQKELLALGKNGPAMVRSAMELGDLLVKNGVYSDAERERWLAMQSDAEGIKVIRKMLEYHGRSPIEVEGVAHARGSVTASDLQRRQGELMTRRAKGENVDADWAVLQADYSKLYGDAPSGRSVVHG